MGLDSRINFIGRPSDDQINRYKNKNITHTAYELLFLSEDEYQEDKYSNIRDYFKPIHIKRTVTDWDRVYKDCGHDYNDDSVKMTLIGNHIIGFSDGTEYSIDIWNGKYDVEKEFDEYCCVFDEVYRWMRTKEQQAIRELFDKEFPEAWDEYTQEYEIGYAKHYILTPELVEKMKKLDSQFAEKFNENIEECCFVYSADW